MKNMRINVRQAHSDTYNGNPYIAFAGIMTGLLSVILFVDELDAVSFTVVGVLLFSGIYEVSTEPFLKIVNIVLYSSELTSM